MHGARLGDGPGLQGSPGSAWPPPHPQARGQRFDPVFFFREGCYIYRLPQAQSILSERWAQGEVGLGWDGVGWVGLGFGWGRYIDGLRKAPMGVTSFWPQAPIIPGIGHTHLNLSLHSAKNCRPPYIGWYVCILGTTK